MATLHLHDGCSLVVVDAESGKAAIVSRERLHASSRKDVRTAVTTSFLDISDMRRLFKIWPWTDGAPSPERAPANEQESAWYMSICETLGWLAASPERQFVDLQARWKEGP